MGRRWSDIPWVVEQRVDGAVTLLARCRDREVATYMARITSAVMPGDVTLRDAGQVNRDRVLARYHAGKPVREGTMPTRMRDPFDGATA